VERIDAYKMKSELERTKLIVTIETLSRIYKQKERKEL
jgi:hypothetical protein